MLEVVLVVVVMGKNLLSRCLNYAATKQCQTPVSVCGASGADKCQPMPPTHPKHSAQPPTETTKSKYKDDRRFPKTELNK